MRVGGRRRRRHCRRPGIASDREVLAVPYPGFGWPDDSCCLRAAAEGLQPGHPGEQRIEAGSHEIGQPPIKRAAGTGLALADDLPGHPDHHRARRDGLDHDGIGADPAVLADLDRTEDLGPGADDHAVTDGGMAFPANHATAAESDAVIGCTPRANTDFHPFAGKSARIAVDARNQQQQQPTARRRGRIKRSCMACCMGPL